MQGETLSPLLFSLYINNLEINFVKDNCPSLEIQEVSLFFLMYADDMVLFSESQEGLQHMLNTLSEYSAAWNLNVNTSKTKIVVFRNRYKVQRKDVWLYSIEVLDIVDELITWYDV